LQQVVNVHIFGERRRFVWFNRSINIFVVYRENRVFEAENTVTTNTICPKQRAARQFHRNHVSIQ
jgi:hypothetical protein